MMELKRKGRYGGRNANEAGNIQRGRKRKERKRRNTVEEGTHESQGFMRGRVQKSLMKTKGGRYTRRKGRKEERV